LVPPVSFDEKESEDCEGEEKDKAANGDADYGPS
jgi:hypothetical protein